MKRSANQKKKQHGITIVEFTIVASLFFILIFSIIEFGRLMFTWHTLNETTRRAARLASVCQVSTAEQADIITSAFIDSVPLPNFTAANIELRYLRSDGTAIGNGVDLTNPATFNTIDFVEARIRDYQINLIIPLATFDIDFTAPDFSTILPRESLGVTRTGFTDC
ncbi:TadE/TadG family type IV pilus assembly protein [Photobacterium lipolyticum]|uniref:TadZ/CpaE protein n=1 Tax=Photobacterium lipolyticum TaxID=266810 RepID=A0A2T3MZ59_9GAMM|nr:TadE/TadG family type IV pilus assembly protein [Photobacterium lipolyticum]PSW05149.1 TadZ/CpaE protein [Photobacterium lipolyticum]